MVDTERHHSDAPTWACLVFQLQGAHQADRLQLPAISESATSAESRLPAAPTWGPEGRRPQAKAQLFGPNTQHRAAWYLLDLPTGLVEVCRTHIIVAVLPLPSPASSPFLHLPLHLSICFWKIHLGYGLQILSSVTYDWFATILSQSSPALLVPSVAHRLCSLPPLAIQHLAQLSLHHCRPCDQSGHFSIARHVPLHTSASQSLGIISSRSLTSCLSHSAPWSHPRFCHYKLLQPLIILISYTPLSNQLLPYFQLVPSNTPTPMVLWFHHPPNAFISPFCLPPRPLPPLLLGTESHPSKFYAEALISKVIAFGDRAFKEVIKIK